jgi:aerobic carbon-monoxide dehydrogenase medium subunit
MKPAPFVYHAPRELKEAIATLAEVAPADGRILAGGQSLVPSMAFRLARPAHLVDINADAGLNRLAVADDSLAIGACIRHAAFHRPVTDAPLGTLLSAVVGHIAHYPIRTRGTFCGSLAHADPASEWCLVAVTLGATIVAQSVRGTRQLTAEEHLRGIMTTALEPDEVLTEARLPVLASGTRCGFYEFNRRAGDYAIAMALATLRLDDGVIVAPRLGLGGVEDRPRRNVAAEAVLDGRAPEAWLLRRAADAAAETVEPLEDLQTSAEYRRDLVRVVTRRALERALG